jgi:SAM-dependent methyltransferase
MAKLYTDDAELYDIAFDWDVTDEVEWLLERLGAKCRSVLEPGCGSGRMLEALARRGIKATGIDLSLAMVELARRRLGERGTAVVADMTNFHLGRTFDGAISPINTLMHLTPDELAAHLHATARHLRLGGRYLVQLGILDPDEPPNTSRWEMERGDTRLRIEWGQEEVDPTRARQIRRSRIEVITGPRAGDVVEEEHLMTAWTWDSWKAAIEPSPFDEIAVYDGNKTGRPCVERGATSGLLWHELVVVP